jgi:hypothetical protein
MARSIAAKGGRSSSICALNRERLRCIGDCIGECIGEMLLEQVLIRFSSASWNYASDHSLKELQMILGIGQELHLAMLF